MKQSSVFSDLGPAQLHYLKSQYLASLQMVDQTETALKAQLEEVSKARTQLKELMRELDRHLEIPIDSETPAAPTAPAKKPGRPRARRPDSSP